MLGDVVDRAGSGTDTHADQRALPCSVPGSGADGGATTRTDRRARRGATPGGREA